MSVSKQAGMPASGEAEASTMHQPIQDIPFIEWLGVSWRRLEPGKAELVLEPLPHHLNSLGMAHGGVVMTMLDVAMARAGATLARPDRDERSVMITIEMKSSFMAPALGRLRAEGRVIRRTSSMAFCEADLFGGDDQLAACAMGTFRYLKQGK